MAVRQLEVASAADPNGSFRLLLVDDLLPPGRQIREEAGDLEELAESFREVGQLTPIVVVPTGRGQFEIVCGLRRWLAAQQAGQLTVECWIRQLTPGERLTAMLADNLLHQTLTRLEEARGYRQLVEIGYSHRKIGAAVGKSASLVCK